jgi:hypothetical protein
MVPMNSARKGVMSIYGFRFQIDEQVLTSLAVKWFDAVCFIQFSLHFIHLSGQILFRNPSDEGVRRERASFFESRQTGASDGTCFFF